MPELNQIFKKNKESAKKYLGPKALNRRQLMRQNLIFLAVAIIIMAGLAALVVFSLSFIIGRINQSFKTSGVSSQNIVQFDLKNFQQIQNKLGIVLTIPSPTPTPTPIATEEATSTPVISLTPLPNVSEPKSSVTPTPVVSPSVSATPFVSPI